MRRATIRTDRSLPPQLPDPEIEPRSRWLPSLVWVIPLIAALIGIALVIKSVTERGPTITISFVSAEGLEPGKTKVKYKDVDVGSVKTITLSKDLSHVLVQVQLTKEGEDFAVKDSRFWVVRPRVGASGVSGLTTLLSGAYIGADAGHSPDSENEFRRPRNAAADHRRPEGPPVRPARRLARLDRHRLADLLPARAGRPGGRLLARQGRHRRDHAGLRVRAVRPVRRHQFALVACKRRRSAARFQRLQAEHAVAGHGDRGRLVVPVAAGSGRGRAGAEQHDVPARLRRSGRDARTGRRAVARSDELQPVAAWPVGRRAGRFPRHRAGPGDEHQHRLRSENAQLHDAGDA